jgi:quinol monooxygenase YgiN
MLAVHVTVKVKAECVEKFIEVTKANIRESLKEAGIAQFDFAQRKDEPTTFSLVEVFSTPEAPALHKATKHYADWAVIVADMMAAPRSSTKFETIDL